MDLSTATPERLPDIETLRRLTKSIAMLEAIICPEWEYRYFSYNSKWAEGEEMASMRNGSGDEWFLLFDKNGAALKGLAHESPVVAEGAFARRIQETVPKALETFLKEPAFAMEWASFCIWRARTDSGWKVVLPAEGHTALKEDGSEDLIWIFDGKPETYQEWAQDYYGRDIPLKAVQAIYAHQALSEELVSALNEELGMDDLVADAREIGYPN